MRERVVVAMSGGVDSAVAACLLKEQGYEVIGMTMCFNLPDSDRRRPSCCGIQGIEDARRVAHKLGIRHYVLSLKKVLNQWVIKDFCKEYASGRTPNPCVRCNQYLKFGYLLNRALSLDARFLATGHYARVSKTKKGYLLKKGKDRFKDQSYFLYRLTQSELKHILFPLGGYTKQEARNLAQDFGLAIAKKPASQEICFLPDNDYCLFLEKEAKISIRPGAVVDQAGKVLGRHKGICYYTVGQREGLGIAKGYPLYITAIDHRRNQIRVGTRQEACQREFLVKEPHFIAGRPKKRIAARVKIRYNHKEALAEIRPIRDKLRVSFRKPQFAIAPGQSAVFYHRDKVLGGGIIDRVI